MYPHWQKMKKKVFWNHIFLPVYPHWHSLVFNNISLSFSCVGVFWRQMLFYALHLFFMFVCNNSENFCYIQIYQQKLSTSYHTIWSHRVCIFVLFVEKSLRQGRFHTFIKKFFIVVPSQCKNPLYTEIAPLELLEM